MKILITGGMGFIGINAALYFADAGHNVVVLDNLNKLGLLKYIDLVKGKGIELVKGDIRDWNTVETIFASVKRFDVVIHLAGQTAVTHSITDPIDDFQNNMIGTFYLLEAFNRSSSRYGKFIYASTNKVYGNLPQHTPIEKETSYSLSVDSIDESEPLDFHSPYGCSKGASDQYVRDYHRIYELNTNVVRQSCIYGPYQDGTADQGWVAWFVKAFIEERPIAIYGDGKQARDILHVADLINFYKILIEKGPAGEVYNLGGGKYNVISLLELMTMLKKKIGPAHSISFVKERPGDQKVFISNNAKAEGLGWRITMPIEAGIDTLIEHLKNESKKI